MKHTKILFLYVFLLSLSSQATAEEKLRLETTFIKGNKEMPQIIYVVPWKDLKDQVRDEQRLVLHSLFGDLFDPVILQSNNVTR